MAPKKKETTGKEKKDKVSDVASKQRFRNFCATLNNYTDECVQIMQVFMNEYCSYGVFGKEVGESGTPHLQIYCELKARMASSSKRKVTPSKIKSESSRLRFPFFLECYQHPTSALFHEMLPTCSISNDAKM